jgi:hypothetical protein
MTTDHGLYDLDVTTFQMCVLFAWNDRQYDKITFEALRMITALPATELRRTLMVGFGLFNFRFQALRFLAFKIGCFCFVFNDFGLFYLLKLLLSYVIPFVQP